MMRFVLALMLVVVVCIHPAIHLVTELGRMFGGRAAEPKEQPAPTAGVKAAATKNREEAKATARAVLRGPGDAPDRPNAVAAAEPAAKLLDVAGEFLAAMDDPGKRVNGEVEFEKRPRLKAEPGLDALARDHQSKMIDLVIAREKLVEEKGKDKLDDLVRSWLASCKESPDGFAKPDKAIESLEQADSAYRELVQKWKAKKLPLGAEATGLAERWEKVSIAFGKLKAEPGPDRLVALAELHEAIDESDHPTLRKVAQNWVEKWLPEGDLKLDPNVELWDKSFARWVPVERKQVFVVWSSRPNKGEKILYEPHKGKFAEFDLSSDKEISKKISKFSMNEEDPNVYDGYTKIKPTEWSQLAHAYNLQRNSEGRWTKTGFKKSNTEYETNPSLEKWKKECERFEVVRAKWKDDEAPEKQKIVTAYMRASALFKCLDKCQVLFPATKEKQP